MNIASTRLHLDNSKNIQIRWNGLYLFHLHPLLINMSRKNKKKMISLVCNECGGSFDKELKEYTRRMKNSPTCVFFCSKKCSSKKRQCDEYSPFRTFLSLARKNAKSKRLKINVDLEYLKTVWENQNGLCFYTQIPMTLFPSRHKTEFRPDCPSLDRMDSSKGYVKGNVRFVCLSINYARNRFQENDFVNFLRRINFGDCCSGSKGLSESQSGGSIPSSPANL